MKMLQKKSKQLPKPKPHQTIAKIQFKTKTKQNENYTINKIHTIIPQIINCEA